MKWEEHVARVAWWEMHPNFSRKTRKKKLFRRHGSTWKNNRKLELTHYLAQGMNNSRVFLEIPRVGELLSASQQGLRCILQISPSKWCSKRYWPRGSPGRQPTEGGCSLVSTADSHNFTRSHCHLVYANLTLVVLLLWDYRTGDSRPMPALFSKGQGFLSRSR